MKKYFFLVFVLITKHSFCQDYQFAKHIVDTLNSPVFWGRGYTNSGMSKAASFLAKQLQSYGLKPLNSNSFFQTFTYSVNTFPAKMEVSINGIKLVPGKDFIISPYSRGVNFKGKLLQKDTSLFSNANQKVLVSIHNKLTWSVARKTSDVTEVQVDRKVVQQVPFDLKLIVENRFVKAFTAANVGGIIKGTINPDSIIVVAAHYDHLGGMGNKTYFPGANDNASGVALLLSLAKFYASSPQPYSMAFICFAGEEAGLIGSKHFTENAILPLSKIRFLLNLDLVGTGDEGITVVNATEFQKEFSYLNRANDSSKYVVKINARGKAANSDHYWFSEKGVPSFFIYTLGGIKAYHDVFDRAETLPLNEYNDLFKLIVDFNTKLMKSEL